MIYRKSENVLWMTFRKRMNFNAGIIEDES